MDLHYLTLKNFWMERPDRRSHGDDDNLLIVAKVNRVTCGGIAFKRAASELWKCKPSSMQKNKTVAFLNLG